MTVKTQHKMTSFNRFVASNRVRQVEDSVFPDKSLAQSWIIVGGISYYYGKREDEVWVHVPNGFPYQGPVIPAFFRKRLKVTDGVFKAGIVHEYLRTKGKIRIRGLRYVVDQEQADFVFLEAMQVAGVNWFKRNFYYYLARITKDSQRGIEEEYRSDHALSEQ